MNLNLHKPFKLFSNCIPVKGANRSVICDLQRNILKLIPNDLFEILENQEGKSIDAIMKIYNNEYDDIIEEYFIFLLENDFIFFTNTTEWFPKLEIKWDSESTVTNAILEVNKKTNYDLMKVVKELEELNCYHFEIRFYDKIDIEDINSFLTFLDTSNSTISSIDYIFPFYEGVTTSKINKDITQNKRVSSVRVFGSPANEIIPYKIEENYFGKLIYTKKTLKNNSCCGTISETFFPVNMNTFMESKLYNSCLNRKISIDIDGKIRNCPSMEKSFGNIMNVKLKEVIKSKELTEKWAITKDQIETCKVCEFRYVCTDCRAYIEKPDDIYSKPLKCGYDPYSNEWTVWSTNPLKQKAIKYYNNLIAGR
ncbi:SPASM domain peptide maturase, grasp-with-spasm system [Tenacibaculum sp. MAR_2009_124]|uniref:grasp-with-spasm system SPASM domain peptide maturase n=1 Tax=Tenacibaculum sp. MAR_2009_124 TaxID=1250059 RepID=UPI00089C9C55|nr:grasp-with-spasm system SPASM domain peptide maturase [Tenacibaculum sp. MAR_2009_124]SEC28682.1 SPASM domain peptide maturase, grasp-with-spasm system [Tenacibaculum sp. MAR_2009_124]